MKKLVIGLLCIIIIMKMFLLIAISIVFTLGIKFEYILYIVKGQGVGKSTFFRLLTINDDWFTDDIKSWMMKIFTKDCKDIG